MITAEMFQTALRAWLRGAAEAGASHADVNSGELHRLVGQYPGTNHRMPMCCEAMYAEQHTDDETLSAPEKGKGASLTIRYKLPRW